MTKTVYVVMTYSRSGWLVDLEVMDAVPTFGPNEVEDHEIRVRVANVNGGDSLRLRWTGDAWVESLEPAEKA